MNLTFKSRDDFSFNFELTTINEKNLRLESQVYNFNFHYQDYPEITTYEGEYVFNIENGANYKRKLQKGYIIDAKREYNKKLNINRFKLNYVNDL